MALHVAVRVQVAVAAALLLASCRELPLLLTATGLDPNGQAAIPGGGDANVTSLLPNAAPVPYLSTSGGQVSLHGAAVNVHGVSWFGFETGAAMVQGSWTGDAITSDFATVVRRMRALGINAVRLPFSFGVLNQTTRPASLLHTCTEATDAVLAASITPPGGQPPSTLTPLPSPPPHTAGQCNDYLPNDSVWNEFVWVAQFFARNGFYVLVDDHGLADPLAVNDPNAWLRNWTALASQLTADPNLAEQLMIGPLADVESLPLQWQANNGKVGAGDLFLQAMDALHPVAPHALFYVGGTAQRDVYGDGFATSGFDANDSNSLADDATPFFQAVVQRPYARQLVIAPNAYGPAVMHFTGATTGAPLMAALSHSFGYLNHTGFCDAGVCTRFAVSVWAFGSDFSNTDAPTMTDIASYMTNQGDGNDGAHDAIMSWFYWCWNGVASPSMGLLDSQWSNLQWNKVTYMQGVGLP